VDTLGIDIGGTKIAVGRVNPSGGVLELQSEATPSDDPGAIISVVTQLVSRFSRPTLNETVGVAAAAFLDADRETVYMAPNIAWRDYPLRSSLENALGRNVVLENDANAAGWAEYSHGAGVGHSSLMMLTIGTGVGGAIVEQGRLYRGGFGAGAELGHTVVEYGGKMCGCGTRGCVEQYASGTALVAHAGELLGRNVSPTELTELLLAGDAVAREALNRVGTYLGRALVTLVAIVDPEIIVIGGGVSAAGELLLSPIRQEFEQTYGPLASRPVPKIVVASLGNNAGVVGAAALARSPRRAAP
jgi:glucokinase